MRARLTVLAVGLAVFGVAMWFLLGGSPSTRDGSRPGADDVVGEDGARGRGGVGSRETTSAEDRVRGRVIDEDGQPLRSGSLVLSCLDSDPPGELLKGGAIRVGDEGAFEGPGCHGRVCVELRHAFMIQDGEWVLEPGRPRELRARMLERLEGTLVDPEGDPVAGGRLTMVPPPDDLDPTALPPFVSRNATTDADGHFSFSKLERPACDLCGEAMGRCDPDEERGLPTYATMLLTARADGYRFVELPVDADALDAIEVRLAAPAPPLTGTLRDPEGRPYPRARLLARSRDRPHEQHGIDLESAEFGFDELGEGSYDLRAVQDGVELATREDATSGIHVDLVGTLSAVGPDLIVKVFGAHGRPLRDAVIDGGPLSGARTDAQGAVRATAVMPGPYTLRVRSSAERAFSRRISVPETDEPYVVELRAEAP